MPEEPAAPAPEGDIEDLFKETTPATEPAAPDLPAPSGDVEDLFKETSDPTAPATDAPKPDDVDDLFSEPKSDDKSATTVPTGTMRNWTDNTGKYHVHARLVMVSQTHIRLLKDNGRYTTVSFSRLSNDDTAFVRQNWTGGIASW